MLSGDQIKIIFNRFESVDSIEMEIREIKSFCKNSCFICKQFKPDCYYECDVGIFIYILEKKKESIK